MITRRAYRPQDLALKRSGPKNKLVLPREGIISIHNAQPMSDKSRYSYEWPRSCYQTVVLPRGVHCCMFACSECVLPLPEGVVHERPRNAYPDNPHHRHKPVDVCPPRRKARQPVPMAFCRYLRIEAMTTEKRSVIAQRRPGNDRYMMIPDPDTLK